MRRREYQLRYPIATLVPSDGLLVCSPRPGLVALRRSTTSSSEPATSFLDFAGVNAATSAFIQKAVIRYTKHLRFRQCAISKAPSAIANSGCLVRGLAVPVPGCGVWTNFVRAVHGYCFDHPTNRVESGSFNLGIHARVASFGLCAVAPSL